jgi:ubiquitin C-terminal hydrolase
MIQQNLSSKRIWCNDCRHEVFDDHRNRRPSPAIWIPSQSPDTEPPRGLYNIGNTCFMNAALQNVLAVTPLTSYFMGDVFKLDGMCATYL